MGLPKQSKPPRLHLRIESKATMSDDLAFFGQYVGPRRRMENTDPRNQAQKEDFCQRRLLLGLAQVNELPFPLTLEAPAEGLNLPDFVLYWNQTHDPLGVEVTEAGQSDWQKWLTTTEAAASDEAILLPGDGYVGDQPEQIVFKDVQDAISKKLKKLRGSAYSGVSRCDLLIYENSEGGIMADDERVIAKIRARGWEAFGDGDRFSRLHLIMGDIVHVDLFGQHRAVNVAEMHGDGWITWLSTQAMHLRNRNFDALDVENLIQEIESLSRSDRRKLSSQLKRLLAHLLKWRFQPTNQSASWEISIASARAEVEEVLAENPSFENRFPEVIRIEYPRAVRVAAEETGLALSTFPAVCPFTVDDIRDENFLPGVSR